jgi:hypothetical protein
MRAARILSAALAVVALAAMSPASAGAAADTTAPVPGQPEVRLRGASITADGIPLVARWVVKDPSGIASSQVQLRVDGGSWVTQHLSGPTARRAAIRVPGPHEGEVRVRATDRAGNTGPWVLSKAFRVTRHSGTGYSVQRIGQWTEVHSSGFFGGSAYRSTTPGARLEITAEGHMVGLVGRRAPTGGSVSMWTDDSPSIRASLRATVVRERQVIGGLSMDEGVTRQVHVEVAAGTVWFDGFVVLDDAAAYPVLVGAGDIATCGLAGDSRTARLLDGIAGRVFSAGDAAYPSGSRAQFRDCYGPTWGRWRLRTSPVPGNHEYRTTGAAGYFGYFGARAGERGRGWYAYNLGTWRIYSLNANCSQVGCGPGSAQVRWLEADLAAHPRACVAAVWHQPLFSSGQHGGTAAVRTLWQVLDAAGADIVLNGHDHDYERFAPQDADGRPDPDGMVEFVVGTGGAGLRPFATIAANSVVRDHSAHGVLKLTLGPGGYDFAFVPVPGSSFRDTGSRACR